MSERDNISSPLEELLQILRIDFPISITTEEVENGLIEYLRREVPCEISYGFSFSARKYGSVNRGVDERYVTELSGSINRPSSPVSSEFDMVRLEHPDVIISFFSGIEFEHVPGYDSIGEFKTLPTGNEQLEMIDRVRLKTLDYFSQRPK